MKVKIFLGLILLLLLSAVLACCSADADGPHNNAQNTSDDAAIERYRKLLEANPDDANARESLKRLVGRPNSISDEQDRRIREILRQYARPGRVSIVSKDEPGAPLAVSGTVRNAAGQPIVGALLYLFHTDAQGHYARGSAMNERNARLFAFIKTDGEGRFEFKTVRPGGYPAPPGHDSERDQIPQHIHIQVSAAGYQFRNLQMVFQDDPRMTPYWLDWARKRNHPVVTVNRDKDGVQHAVCEIILLAQ
jgi:protocatechuate 3,4-dioxygenase beta subunit